MYKVTVLYKHPGDVDQFEKYFEESHLPLARKMPYVSRLELSKFDSGPGETPPEYYGMAEIYYSSREIMQESMGTHESQEVIDDLHNFATGGVTVLLGAAQEGL